MFTRTMQGDNIKPYVSEFIADTAEELEEIDVSTLSPGSTCIVIEGVKIYMLNNSKKWILLS